MYMAASTTVRLVSLLAAYGFYEMNANDIGFSNAVKQTWKAI